MVYSLILSGCYACIAKMGEMIDCCDQNSTTANPDIRGLTTKRPTKNYILPFIPRLYHFVLEMIKSRQLAEEIISDVFIKIWEKRKTLEEILNLRVYCFVAAKNLTLNQLEKQKREATCNIDEYAGDIPMKNWKPGTNDDYGRNAETRSTGGGFASDPLQTGF